MRRTLLRRKRIDRSKTLEFHAHWRLEHEDEAWYTTTILRQAHHIRPPPPKF